MPDTQLWQVNSNVCMYTCMILSAEVSETLFDSLSTLWRLSSIATDVKWRPYCSLVLSVMCFNAEVSQRRTFSPATAYSSQDARRSSDARPSSAAHRSATTAGTVAPKTPAMGWARPIDRSRLNVLDQPNEPESYVFISSQLPR